MQTQTNPQLQLAYNFLQYTNQNVFLTGKAGTGKTTFMKNLKQNSPKRMVVVAPTGVAAINAGGVTIHSFFQLSFGPQLPYVQVAGKGYSREESNPPAALKRFNKEKINIIRSFDLLVIDEVSMVRADVLDGIDSVLRRFRERDKPFGGVQLLMIGDLQQLAPIVKEDEWEILKNYYDTCFFFSSRALKQSTFVGIELKKIFRQTDQQFINLLNKVRNNSFDEALINELNKRYIPGFDPSDDEGYITLTTHNYQSKQINSSKLNALKTTLKCYDAVVEGDFPEYAYPTDEHLALKEGAQVMFVKNDPSYEKLFYNGKIGQVTKMTDEGVVVSCKDDAEPIFVVPTEWENARYKLNEQNQEIEEEVIGKFIQLPLKLAWAITIHKSQGLTFDKAIIDARQSFAHGQVYVALSRCRSIDGMVLRTPLSEYSVISDKTVVGFTENIEKNQPGNDELNQSRAVYELQLIKELFDFSVIIRNGHYILKIWDEHNQVLDGNLPEKLREIIISIERELKQIASNFEGQVEKLLQQNGFIEKNQLLQERLKKASAWFLEKLENLIEIPLDNAVWETDNRALKKTVSEALNRLELGLSVKKACMKLILEEGFNIKHFLETRAKASIEKPVWKRKEKAIVYGSNNPEFFRILAGWRDNKADELDMNLFGILSHKVMVAISNQLPPTAAELKAVKGMGGKKMQLFGKEILAMIIQYRQQKNLELPVNAKMEVALAGLETKEISLKLYEQGLKTNEIAQKRDLKTSTIESHLAHFIARGQVNVFDLIDKEKYNAIAQKVKESPIITSSEIRDALGHNVSYGEIKMVLADLGR
ncbi:MAG: helix-turn-helix domain-containing protein [Prolixibacteraceae bacterium]|nr:helix-turn-helix domain-containing protein [Prolixibacteraceae bacterium]